MLTWRFAHVLMTMAFGAGLAACFNPPAEAVLFACDAKTAPTCPAGYTCAADDCCHRDGSDVDAELGRCRIGGGMSASAGTSEPGSSSTGATDGATDSPTTSGSVTTSTASSGATSSGGTDGDTGSSDASTTP